MLISDLIPTITSRISTLSPGQQINFNRGRCDRDHMVVGFTTAIQLPMQSMPIATDVVSSNLDQGKVYNII